MNVATSSRTAGRNPSSRPALARIGFILLSLIAVPVFSSASPIGPILSSYSGIGTFTSDNDVQLFYLSISSESYVTIRTVSYAAGGFAPELTLFDSSGNQLASDSLSATYPNCYGRPDSGGLCLDAYIYDTSRPPLVLNAGDYDVALTQYLNDPQGLLSDGFGEDSLHGDDPNFTARATGYCDFDPSSACGFMFIDPFNNIRSGNWSVDISIDPVPANSVPEPASGLLLLAGLPVLAFLSFCGRVALTR